MYTPIYSKNDSSIAAASRGYSHPPPPPTRLPPGDPSHDPVLEAAQGPLHTGGQDPRLQPEKQHRLDDRLKEKIVYPRVCPLPAQDRSCVFVTAYTFHKCTESTHGPNTDRFNAIPDVYSCLR